MKTKSFILALLSPVALALTGCDKHEPETTPPAATNAAAEKQPAPPAEKPMTPAETPAMTPAPVPPAPTTPPDTNTPTATNQ